MCFSYSSCLKKIYFKEPKIFISKNVCVCARMCEAYVCVCVCETRGANTYSSLEGKQNECGASLSAY